MLWRLNRSGDKPVLERVKTDSLHYEPDRKRVVLFPGAGLHDQLVRFEGEDGERTLAGSIKYVEQTLASTLSHGATPVDIYLYSYEEPYDDGPKRNHYRLGRAMEQYGENAGRHVLQNLLLRDGERLSQLSPDEIKQRLSQVTMVGHSYGSIIMQDVTNRLADFLRLAGFEPPVIADTLKELVSVSVAPIARTDYPAPNATQYFFNSINDITAIDSIRRANPDPVVHLPVLHACGYGRVATILERHGGELPRAELLATLTEEVERERRPGTTPVPKLRVAASGYTISSMLPDDHIHWMEKRPDGDEICRMLNKQESERTKTAVVHDYRAYLHGDHKLGDVLINVMNNAVQRDVGIGDGHQLLMTTEQTRAQHESKLKNSRNAQGFVSERGIA